MEKKDLVVLVCKQLKNHPRFDVNVSDFDEAIKVLSEEKLDLEYNPAEQEWTIFHGAHSMDGVMCNVEVGSSAQFSIQNPHLQGVHYRVGVYDRTNKYHLQNMVDAVRRETEEHTRRGYRSQLDDS